MVDAGAANGGCRGGQRGCCGTGRTECWCKWIWCGLENIGQARLSGTLRGGAVYKGGFCVLIVKEMLYCVFDYFVRDNWIEF